MARKIWDDWKVIGDAIAFGRKVLLGCLILAMAIALFVPMMA